MRQEMAAVAPIGSVDSTSGVQQYKTANWFCARSNGESAVV